MQTRQEKKARKTRVVLGITGSIAAYKSVELARYLMSKGCDVRAVMTESASRFVTPFLLESITRNPVTVSFWNETQAGAIGHIELADWADVLVVAPASADLIAKLRYGFAETPLLAVALATKAPIVLAPAMNVNMYENKATQDNLESLRSRGFHIVEPDAGALACGWTGRGRLAEAREIFWQARRALSPQDLSGKRVIITAGPTREAIDPVRYISNRSSGKMGLALAREAHRRGAHVVVVCGPVAGNPWLPRGIERASVTSASEMHEAVMSRFRSREFDIAILAAAVADFRPAQAAQEKIKKTAAPDTLALVPNNDILRSLGEGRGSSAVPLLVGFAVETGDVQSLAAEARRKMARKGADMIVGNLAKDSFDKDTNQVYIVARDGSDELIPTMKKSGIARRIFDRIAVLQGSPCLHEPVQH